MPNKHASTLLCLCLLFMTSCAPSSPAIPDTPEASLGITRADAARLFQLLEFEFELIQSPGQREDYVGTVSDGLATVHLIGPNTGVLSVSVVIDVPTPPTQNQSGSTMAYLAIVLTVAAEDWADGTAWLNEKLNVIGQSRIAFGGKEAILLLQPGSNAMHVEFTISAAP